MQLMEGRTVLLITHRLSALAGLVDEVIVLDEGRIVEQGAAQTLLARDGAFSTLLRNDSVQPAGQDV